MSLFSKIYRPISRHGRRFNHLITSSHSQRYFTSPISSSSKPYFLAPDTYRSLPLDGETTFLHSMLRVNDLAGTIAFFEMLGLQETRRRDSENGKFTLVFMASSPGAPEIELTHNWTPEEFAPSSRNFGHLAFAVDNIYNTCTTLEQGVIDPLSPIVYIYIYIYICVMLSTFLSYSSHIYH